MTTISNPMIQKLLTKKGQIATMTTERPMKVRKGQPSIIKTSTFQARIGVDYNNIKAVKEKRESGVLAAVPQELPYGKWLVFPYIIETETDYQVRCSKFSSNFKPRTVYKRAGVEISKDEAAVACLASEFKENTSEVFNIKISSILDVK